MPACLGRTGGILQPHRAYRGLSARPASAMLSVDSGRSTCHVGIKACPVGSGPSADVILGGHLDCGEMVLI